MVSVDKSNALAVLYLVTMVVDFVILLLTTYKTYTEYRDMYHSGLIKLIFRDGLAYFAVIPLKPCRGRVCFDLDLEESGGLIQTFLHQTFCLLRLNSTMNLMGVGPASSIATIGACRLVRRLNCYVGDTPKLPTILYSSPMTVPPAHSAVSREDDGVRVEVTASTVADTNEEFTV
ncbi:hypothetical protein PM082_014885 [Marasmius tenuissimus]|nr:hypothetical protein PM082_014885 [Marasmius tenuissimus]